MSEKKKKLKQPVIHENRLFNNLDEVPEKFLADFEKRGFIVEEGPEAEAIKTVKDLMADLSDAYEIIAGLEADLAAEKMRADQAESKKSKPAVSGSSKRTKK